MRQILIDSLKRKFPESEVFIGDVFSYLKNEIEDARTTLIFAYEPNGSSTKIIVQGQEYKREALQKFDWFFHPDLALNTMNPYLTVELRLLAQNDHN